MIIKQQLPYLYHNSKKITMKSDQYQNEKQLQFQFDLEIQKIKLLNVITIPKSSYLQVIWRRGQKNISTKIKPEIKGTQDEIFFGETLSMISTCTLNTDTHQFSQKQSIVSAVIYISGSQKLFGSVTINLSSVLSSKNFYQRNVKFIEQQLNGRAKSKIFMKLSSNYLKQKMKGDEMSIGSGANSYNNTSSYSIDRRMLEIPSKDTYSVLSYGGAARYSAKKDDTNSIRRDDSTKKIEEQSVKQYGRYGTYTTNNYYNKPTSQYNLTQPPTNITTYQPHTTNPPQPAILTIQSGSNIKSISSIPSSANRIPRSTQSEHNRSSVGEQSSRLLIEQQTKRSKLEAEATKNRVENEELKNKLSEYVRENMKLKEEARKFYQNSDCRQAQIKKQSEQLKQRNYVLMNQIRQLKSRFDKYINLQKQCIGLRAERDNLQKQQKVNEDTVTLLRKQLQQNKYQFSRVKQAESRLLGQLKQQNVKASSMQIQQNRRKQLENKLKQLTSQLEYYQSNTKSLSILLKQSQQKYKNYERQHKNMQTKFQATRQEQTRKYTDMVMGKQRQIKDLNQKLNLKNQECTRYIVQAQKVKNQFGKVKDEKISELESIRTKLTSEIQRLSALLRDTNTRTEQLQQQKNNLNTQIRNEIILRSKQSQKSKQTEQALNQIQKKYQKEHSDLTRHLQQLEMENVQLNNLLSQKSKNLQQAQNSHDQIQNLMKQNLQLELELKYKNQEIQKYHGVVEEYENIKFRYTMQENNMRELNGELEKCQRQLKDKNRAYLLECQKTRMLNEERGNNLRGYNQVKEELERAREVIGNGQRQFQDMRNCIDDLQNRNISLMQDIRKLEDKIKQSNPEKYAMQIKSLESRNRQLEARDLQKIRSIQNLTRNLSNSNNQIKQLQRLSEQRLQETLNHQRNISQLQQKIQQFERTLSATNKQLNNAVLDKKNMMKKNQMIMEELYSHKKKLEEQKDKGRVSHPSVHIRSSEDYIKIKNMQNELQKKDEKIRKMEKEIISLENENVNLSIQVMKKLEDITPK